MSLGSAALKAQMTCSPGTTVLVRGHVTKQYTSLLTPSALEFLQGLHRKFELQRQALLCRRLAIRAQIQGGAKPDFLDETKEIRESDWIVAPIPHDLEDRRVEITGPVDRKMVINALNSGANTYMADFEDSTAPSWHNVMDGQINLRDAADKTISYTKADGKHYELNDVTATLLVRPRGWHLDERHILVDGQPISGSLFDFGMYFFHNVHRLIERGTAPYFYLPKLESHLEARLWNDVFVHAQDYLGIPQGTIRETVLIENVLAAFEMHEILWELRDHSAGLNCGRWDYIFSFIKNFSTDPDAVLPDRDQVTMDRHFLKSYVDLLIQTCHRRRVHAIGGMAAQVPIKNDSLRNDAAIAKVRKDKLREVIAGHDGTWVAHPALVPIAREQFDPYMTGPNQIHLKRNDVRVTQSDLLDVPTGTITENGLRRNVSIALQYLEAWLSGTGCVPLYHLMEDAATAEISRSQIWQWVKHRAKLDDGRTITPACVRECLRDELRILRQERRAKPRPHEKLLLASKLLQRMMTSERLGEWLTATAYEYLD